MPVVKVESRRLDHQLDLPGELKAYQNVAIHARVRGFIAKIVVDRGSIVHRGDLMITIFCPELHDQVCEAESKANSAVAIYRSSQDGIKRERANLVAEQAKVDADKLTLSRLQQAAETTGAIAQNDIDVQQKTVESDQARVASVRNEVKEAKATAAAEKSNVQAANNVVQSEKDMHNYLRITAPFDGVVTERNVHEGSIVAVDPKLKSLPLLRVQERDLLRLVVAVPESCVSDLHLNEALSFTVPAYLGRTFMGKIARLGYALDQSTRTMPVELNVWNPTNELEPGMFATVDWHVTRPYNTLFVPSSAVTSDLKGTFVNLVRDQIVRRVPVEPGQTMQDLVEVVGAIKEADTVALKATDDLKTGSRLITRVATQSEIEQACRSVGSE